MIDFTVAGAIFDIDDTLLDNDPGEPGQSLHEQARLQANHEIGAKYGIRELMELSAEDNFNAFLNAQVHSLDAAIWETLRMFGIVDGEVIDSDHPLLKEITALKIQKYTVLLHEHGKAVAGSVPFVKKLYQAIPEHKLAIATNARRDDVIIFLDKVDLLPYFDLSRLKSIEDIEHAKPNPEVYDKAFATLDIPERDRGRVVAFEDDPRGIMSAKAAGLFTCAITTRYSADALRQGIVSPDLVAESYEEFTRLFGL